MSRIKALSLLLLLVAPLLAEKKQPKPKPHPCEVRTKIFHRKPKMIRNPDTGKKVPREWYCDDERGVKNP